MAKARRPIDTRPSVLSTNQKTLALLAAVVVVVGVWQLKSGSDDSADESSSGAVSGYAVPVPAHGPENAPVVLVKYTDFQ